MDADSSMKTSDYKSFTGPLFIVGMPRSGTKLLRGLLNQHPNIGIPDIETQFVPYWSEHWEEYGDLSHKDRFSDFYRLAVKLPYFVYLQEEAEVISEHDWYRSCKNYDLAGVFEALIRHDAKIPFNSVRIWGDKTPSYLNHASILKSLFPEAKFIHIVRDARDYCLSNKKTWNKNMIRAAVRWNERISNFREDSDKFENDLFELTYENLLDRPKLELQLICDFLALEFNRSMLTQSRPSEHFGDAKGQKEIIKGNKKKYLKELDLATRRQIERITKPVLNTYGYPCDYSGPAQHVGKFRMMIYRLMDGLSLVRFEAKQRGFINALLFHFNLFRIATNRSK